MSVMLAKLMSNDEGSADSRTRRKYRTVWRVRCTSITDTAYDVMASSLLPRLGDPFHGWVRQADGTYLANVSPKDASSVVVMLDPRRVADDPRTWDVDVSYDGTESPLATLPEIEYEDVPYQEQQVADIYGLVKTNSALDPYEEGTEVDRNRQRLTITRNVAYTAWDPDLLEGYKNSLNLAPYTHGGLLRSGSPITSPPGTVKLTSLTARRMVRLDNPNPALASYYWQVRAVLDLDYSKYVDNNGNNQLRRWRRVLIDAGYNERVKGSIRRMLAANNAGGSNGPQFLDGAGRRLFLAVTDPDEPTRPVFDPNTAPPLPRVESGSGGVAVPEHDWYACRAGQTLVIPAPGVLANDYLGLSTSATATLTTVADHGTVTLNTNGGFSYVPASSYYGWATFEYQANNGFGASQPAKVCILCGPVPKVRVFEDYPHKDWTAIAYLIGGW